jgi:hypothetical protein
MVDPFKNERGVLDCFVNKILLSKLNRILPFFGPGISAFAVEETVSLPAIRLLLHTFMQVDSVNLRCHLRSSIVEPGY